METSPAELLDRYIRSRYTIIAITTYEERRVMNTIKALADNKRDIFEWSYTTGLRGPGIKDDQAAKMKAPAAALDFIAKFDFEDKAGKEGSENPTGIKPSLFVIKDLHNILKGDQSIMILRYLREISDYFRGRKHNLIMISPTLDLPSDMDKCAVVIDWPLPTIEELGQVFGSAEKTAPETVKVNPNGRREEIIEAMRGLTIDEAGSVLKHAMVATRELSDGAIPFINEEKRQIINKAKILEYFDAGVTMDDVGGLSYLKEYSIIKRAAMSKKAREAGVDAPKGVLLVGVPGSGKSLAAKAIAGGKLPLIRLDIGKLMGKFVGESEGNTRAALKAAESIAPCVFWWDEIEKGLGGMGGEGDGGTSMRVLGTLLTWMQENKFPVYVVATANSTTGLRPELLRRFDDLMFADLPDLDGRAMIFQIHLRKRVPDFKLSQEELVELARATWSYSGSEIEKVVKSALEKAFSEDKPISFPYLRAAVDKIVPLSVTTSEQITAIRAWATEKRAINAGNALEIKLTKDPVLAGQGWSME